MKKIVLFFLMMLPVAVMGQKNSVDYGPLNHEVKTFSDKIGFENPDKNIITYETTYAVELGEEEVRKKIEKIQNEGKENYNRLTKNFNYLKCHLYVESSDGISFDFLLDALRCYLSHVESETPHNKKAAKLLAKKMKHLKKILSRSRIYNDDYVKETLEWYEKYLEKNLKKQTEKLLANLQDSLQERVVITKKNKFYRGRNYKDYRILNLLENSLPAKGWEWLNTNNYIQKEVRYPEQLNYFVFNNVPQYKVFVSWSDMVDNKINHNNAVVYNNKGTLVYVPNIWRGDIEEFNNIEEDIKKIIYLKDYKHNKYNIKQKSGETQAEIIANLSRKNESKYKNIVYPKNSYVTNYNSDYLSTIALVGISIAAQNVKNDIAFKDYWNYKKQLEIDHSAEFGYVYIIERISGVSFRLVYIHEETLKPTYCALVTYKETGDKSYTCDYSIKLIDIPKQIPTPIHIPRGFVFSGIDVKLIDPECKY